MPTPDIDIGAQNTDRELWRDGEDGDRIFVTQSGGIGINCGGRVLVQSLRAWFGESAAPALLAKWEECEQHKQTKTKALESAVRYLKDLQRAQKLLCPEFGDCADKLADGEKCACGFEDGPYGNAVPPNREAERLKSRLAAAEAVVSAARELTKLDPLTMAPVKVCLWYELQGKCALALSTYEGKSE